MISARFMGLQQEQLNIIWNDKGDASWLGQRLFKLMRLFHKYLDERHELSFYGFQSDGGLDQNDQNYWINTVFLKGSWTICTQEGQNMNFKGAMCKQHQQLSKKLEQFYQILKMLFKEIFPEDYYNKLVEFDYIRIFKELIQLNNEMINFLTRKVIVEFGKNNNMSYQNCSDFFANCVQIFAKVDLNLKQTNQKIEEIIQFDEDHINIISQISISREGTFTCPIQTGVIFTDISDFSLNDANLKLFDDCDSDEKLEKLTFKFDYFFQKTNIAKLSNKCYEFDNANSKFKYAIFDQKHTNIRPLCWFQFQDDDLKLINLNLLKGFNATCRFVALKLINCLNKVPQDDPHYGKATNIDINYVSFYGRSFKL